MLDNIDEVNYLCFSQFLCMSRFLFEDLIDYSLINIRFFIKLHVQTFLTNLSVQLDVTLWDFDNMSVLFLPYFKIT